MNLPKYVMVAGPTILVSCDPGHLTVARGTYMPIELPDGYIKLIAVGPAGSHTPELAPQTYTIHKNVWLCAIADYRIYPF